MLAGVFQQPGAAPEIIEFPDPQPQDGMVLIDVETCGLSGADLMYTARNPAAKFPKVVASEGVGRAPDGRRVYFGSHSVAPFGGWAQRTLISAAEVWDMPDGVEDRFAIAMAISATGAYLPLQDANIQLGESVLILGATGVVGQLAAQYARLMGAGRVVGAGRNAAALAGLRDRGHIDDMVQLGAGDEAAAFKAAGAFDMVLDLVCGPALEAAIPATREGARIFTIAAQGAFSFQCMVPHMFRRTFSVVGTGQRPAKLREQTWRDLMRISRRYGIDVDYIDADFHALGDIWARQAAGPHAKITARVPR